jgi:hypothetical protein
MASADELQFGVGGPAPIVGEAVAGQATKVLAQIYDIIKDTNKHTFDLGELLYEAKKNKYFLKLGFDTFGDYGKSLDLKITKLYYLAETMEGAGVPRAKYEPLGTAKLRLIAKINLFDKEGKAIMYPSQNPDDDLTMAECVKGLVEKAKNLSLEEVQQIVEKLRGKTGDDAIVWLNIGITKAAREIVRKAIEIMKLCIGTVAQDEDGKHVDASDGRAIELICADYLSGAPEAKTLDAPAGSNYVPGEWKDGNFYPADGSAPLLSDPDSENQEEDY